METRRGVQHGAEPYTRGVNDAAPQAGAALGPRPTDGPRLGEARTLSPARARMLDRLRAQPEPLTLAALVRATGLHENTLRDHLDGLVRAGLARRQRAVPSGRGRPAWLYAATSSGEHSEYARLASALATGLALAAPDLETAVRSATEAGEGWGHDLAHQSAAGPAATGEQARAEVVGMLDRLGFGPDAAPEHPDQVRLTRCPLLQAAAQHPEVVCAVHLGIVRGALDGLGADPAGAELRPFAEPGACRLVVPPVG